MRKLESHKVSVQRMDKEKKKNKDWRLVTLYMGLVAAITTYFSLILNFLKLIKLSDWVINIIGVVMAFLALLMMYFSKNYKMVDRIHNKKALDDILEAFSVAGVFGFFVEKILNIIPLEKQSWSTIMPFIFLDVIFMFLPVVAIVNVVKREDWKHNVD